ncbi:MAG: hypothetical protein U0T77_01430 [Chitinophagales bacterium]
MIKGISITIVADTIQQDAQLTQWVQLFQAGFSEPITYKSGKVYEKFEDCYKLEFEILAENPAMYDREKWMYRLLLVSEAIARPWLIYFDRDSDSTELIFNRTGQTKVAIPAFEVIRWAHLQFIYDVS